MTVRHKERKHSKFSASGSERWLNCPASVSLEEKSPPSKDNVWSLEGTFAHEVLEKKLRVYLDPDDFDAQTAYDDILEKTSVEMAQYVNQAAEAIINLAESTGGELIAEQRIYQDFIHPEMFGTTDSAVVSLFDTLHVLDFKYGQGHIVDPKENTQLIQYALGFAALYDWNFDSVVLHILQPRAGNKWHKSWKLSLEELKGHWLRTFKDGVKRALDPEAKATEGTWCHWCRARNICPKKVDKSFKRITDIFNDNLLPEEGTNGLKEKSNAKEKGFSKKESYNKESKIKKVSKGFEIEGEGEEKDFF